MIPTKQDLTVCFAHVAYQFQGLFERRRTGINSFQVWNRADLDARIGEADVLVISGLWKNDLIQPAKKLRYIQSIGAGTDQFSREFLSAHGLPGAARVIFTPVTGVLDPKSLAEWVLEDRLDVRVQVQLHKILWGEARGK